MEVMHPDQFDSQIESNGGRRLLLVLPLALVAVAATFALVRRLGIMAVDGRPARKGAMNSSHTARKKSAQHRQGVHLADLRMKPFRETASTEQGRTLAEVANEAYASAPEPVYCLPFARGNSYYVSQGYDGPTHTGDLRYAIDFQLPLGTPIYAARSGRVTNVEQDFVDHARTDDMKTKANVIVVRHEDSTYAMYAHLEPQGSMVKPGQEVHAGELIGYSGNTGYTSGPHLHFEVFRMIRGRQLTMPVHFRTADNPVTELTAGNRYQASEICE